jgi:heat shock protein HslJ
MGEQGAQTRARLLAAGVLAAAALGVASAVGCTARAEREAAATPPSVTTESVAPPGRVAEPESDGLTGTWRLESLVVGNATLKPRPGMRYELEPGPDGGLTGYDGCNYFSGTIVADAASFRASVTWLSAMLCPGADPLHDEFLLALQRVRSYELANEQLVLHGRKGLTVMTWRRG